MLPTLKGVFPLPKIQHKRDFLRENKLHLKELQKNSSRQHSQKIEEAEKLAELQRRQRHRSLDKRQFLSRRGSSFGCCGCCDCGKTISVCCRSESAATETTKVETCTREVQTDDIQDEEFLFEALKRCSSSEVMRDVATSKTSEDDHFENNLPNPTPDNDYDEHNLNFENLAIDNERLPPTASSTQLSTKRSIRRLHELGDRQDIRLPKYLEREKREKELQKQKELQRDRNCPIGYQPLSEEDRHAALNKAQLKFQILVNELNRMPMTTETLRMRNRKVEIERELVELENDIQMFSKPKVYVRANGLF